MHVRCNVIFLSSYNQIDPGHTQFRGKRYCPSQDGQIPKEEWLALRRAEAVAIKKVTRC